MPLRKLPPLTLVLGGARSGKSAYAEELVSGAVKLGGEAAYIATALPHDQEMAERIEEHQKRRSRHWHTVEEELDLIGALRSQPQGRIVLVDCLTLWLSNVMLAHRDAAQEIKDLVAYLPKCHGPVVLVSSEVGLGVVPDNLLARNYRDHSGRMNQAVAAVAQRVVLVTAGLPQFLKDEK